MSTVTFNTQAFVGKLRAACFDEKQVEAVVRVVAEAQEALVTKEHFDAKIELLRAKNTHNRWILDILLGLAVAHFAKQY